MTIHVNIGEAKTRLSELLRATRTGERVIISRDGQPEAELVPVSAGQRLTREQIAARRHAAFGMFRADYTGFDTSVEALKSERGNREAQLGVAD